MRGGYAARCEHVAAIAANTLRGGSPATIDLVAVEDDVFAGKFPDAIHQFDLVDIAPGAKEGHIALLHRPHNHEICHEIERVSMPGDNLYR